jgi:hypothetical protein
MRLRHASLHTKVAATGDKSHASIGSAGLVLEASEFMAAPVDSWQQWQAFGLLMRGGPEDSASNRQRQQRRDYSE